MSIPSLILAIAYLSVIVVGAVGALLLLVWLFRDTAGDVRTRRKKTKSTRKARLEREGMPSARTGNELPEDRAA